MGCGTGLLRVLLVIVNVFFGLLGVTFLAGGIFLKVGRDMFDDETEAVLDAIPGLPDQVNILDAEAAPEGGVKFDLEQIIDPVAAAFIVFGAALLLVCVLGCLGACCGMKICLIVYAVILIVIFLAQLILFILCFTGTLNDDIKSMLNDTLVDDYGGIDSWNHMSVAWNYFMADYGCCGLDGAEDFYYAKKWKQERSMKVNDVTATIALQSPVACCKLLGDFPDVTVADENCAVVPSEATSNYKRGCWDEVTSDLDEHRNMVIGVCVGVLVFQTILIVASLIVYCALSKKKNTIV